MKTIRRNWLKKQIELGKVEAKCNYKLTDDYAFDNAYNFQKSEWMPARISHPKWETITLYNGNTTQRIVDNDFVNGAMNFKEHDFKFSTGWAAWNEDGTIRFCPLSSESYTLRIKEN